MEGLYSRVSLFVAVKDIIFSFSPFFLCFVFCVFCLVHLIFPTPSFSIHELMIE